MTSSVGDLATNPNLQDLDDQHNLSASGGRGEQDYDATVPNTVDGPFGSFSYAGIWFDRDGVGSGQSDTYADTLDTSSGDGFNIDTIPAGLSFKD